MKIALIGYGRMGQAIHKLAEKNGADVTLIVDRSAKEAHAPNIAEADFTGIDTAIDFTYPETALNNIQDLAEKGVNTVMGTTGWYEQTDQVRQIVEQSGIGFIWASNFSIGVHLFWKILREAGKIMDSQEQYDIFAHEFHHKEKKDSPSGTAITTGEIILDTVSRKETLVTEKLDRKPDATELHLSSTRGGHVPGTHAVYFDSPIDTIEVRHTARSRQGFALGAIQCAKWIAGKSGFYNIEDYLASI